MWQPFTSSLKRIGRSNQQSNESDTLPTTNTTKTATTPTTPPTPTNPTALFRQHVRSPPYTPAVPGAIELTPYPPHGIPTPNSFPSSPVLNPNPNSTTTTTTTPFTPDPTYTPYPATATAAAENSLAALLARHALLVSYPTFQALLRLPDDAARELRVRKLKVESERASESERPSGSERLPVRSLLAADRVTIPRHEQANSNSNGYDYGYGYGYGYSSPTPTRYGYGVHVVEGGEGDVGDARLERQDQGWLDWTRRVRGAPAVPKTPTPSPTVPAAPAAAATVTTGAPCAWRSRRSQRLNHLRGLDLENGTINNTASSSALLTETHAPLSPLGCQRQRYKAGCRRFCTAALVVAVIVLVVGGGTAFAAWVSGSLGEVREGSEPFEGEG
ncbi:uncharacterized protein K452DRAFT_102542 [Aplosporella prunicola CBS 121167]|uniref:Uncharacterized protein n=1 Tax=Aplosporella prunicola CBS 121167 TaxID=1176127 RepID=A0A6A6BP80_9PEZI|nr:uncharacterized protein K452DRAFT_102542 [Aplosporella prunicola CBS 121167]KAF2145876.1 hypothetical protein K452DRAFT_102542 [Aplosporella prunicola CBS 121167]